jgi:hypothetical protein
MDRFRDYTAALGALLGLVLLYPLLRPWPYRGLTGRGGGG